MGPHPQQHRGEHDGFAGSLTTQEMRTVGQRRRAAEEKLARHLEEVRHRDQGHDDRDALEKDGGGLPL